MKYILLLLSLTVISCQETTSKEAIEACPLILEFDRLDIRFEITGNVPAVPNLHVAALEISYCSTHPNEDFCIEKKEQDLTSVTYHLISRSQFQDNLQIELYDGNSPRIERTNEAMDHTILRPNDPCGSPKQFSLTIKE